MQMSLLQWLVAISMLGIECLLLVLLFRRKLHAEYRFFAAFLAFDVLGFAALAIATRGTAEQYMYAYWFVVGLSMLLSFLVLYEVFVNALKPFSAVADLTKMLFGWAAVFLLGAGFLTAVTTAGSQANRICAAIVLMERTVQLMQCGLLLLLVLFETRLGLSWRSLSMAIGTGFGVSAAVGLTVSYISERFPANAVGLDTFGNSVRVAVAAIWGIVLLLPQPERKSAQDSPKRLILQRWNEALISYRQAGDIAVASSSIDSFLPGIEKTVDRVLARKIAN